MAQMMTFRIALLGLGTVLILISSLHAELLGDQQSPAQDAPICAHR